MKIFTKLILLVVSVVLISLTATTLVVYNYIYAREKQVVESRISAIAKIVAEDKTVIQGLEQKDTSGTIQQFASRTMAHTGVDFIVVMDTQFVRYSHPVESNIGGIFSNVPDVQATLTNGEHFSEMDGVLGAGIRYFQRIYNEKGDVIGIVCVGYRKTTVVEQLQSAFGSLFVALMIGLGIAIVVTYWFTSWLKKTLLNLEPEEISQIVLQNQYVSEHVTEGILAIDVARKIIFVNPRFHEIFDKAKQKFQLSVGEVLNEELYQLLFSTTLDTQQSVANKRVPVNHVDIVINSNPIYLHEKLYGAVATIRDQSEMQQLITELSTTEKYNDTLRAQSHHFMNQMYVLQGLIDLQQYDEVEKYIYYLKRNYHQHIGHVSDVIKVPSLAGLLLGKIQEAQEQGIRLEIDEESSVPNGEYEALYHDMTIMLGVLIDNAMEAVETAVDKFVQLYLVISEEEQVVMCLIEDTGNGIDDTIKDKIMERGFSTKGEKRGYGLEAVRAIVDKYHGSIDIKSQKHKGTRISIELLLKEDTHEYIDN